MLKVLTAAVLIWTIAASVSPVHACPRLTPLTGNDLDQADLVFIGEPVAYESQTAGNFARIRFTVHETIRGNAPGDTITAYWSHGTFGTPNSLEGLKSYYGSRVRVGLILPETYLGWCKVMLRYNAGTGRTRWGMSCFGPYNARPLGENRNLPWIMNEGCSGPYMFDAETFDERRFAPIVRADWWRLFVPARGRWIDQFLEGLRRAEAQRDSCEAVTTTKTTGGITSRFTFHCGRGIAEPAH